MLRRGAWALAVLGAAAAGSSAAGDPLDQLHGRWQIAWFVGGGGVADFRACGVVTTTAPSAAAVALGFSCGAIQGYEMTLRKAGAGDGYLLSLKGTHQLTVVDCPVAYSEAEGWRGETEMTVDGSSTTVACSVKRRDNGWSIAALPKAEEGQKVGALKTPRVNVTLLKPRP